MLDISKFNGAASDRSAVASELRRILHEHGFFYLSGHGVDAQLISEMLAATKRFFSLPISEKLAIDIVRSPHFRGYTRAGGEITRGRQDWREQVDFDCEEDALPMGGDSAAWRRTIGPNQWPAAMPEFRDTILRYQAEATRVALDVLKAMAIALGQNEDVFAPMYRPQPRQHLKILRYPGRHATSSDQGVGAHKDGGLVTILLQDELPGLWVQAEDGSRIEAPPVPGTFVVNTGELLELATNGFVRADIHGVVAPPARQGTVLDRVLPRRRSSGRRPADRLAARVEAGGTRRHLRSDQSPAP
jgi:isopenicillin N synthase-like dioxygenase